MGLFRYVPVAMTRVVRRAVVPAVIAQGVMVSTLVRREPSSDYTKGDMRGQILVIPEIDKKTISSTSDSVAIVAVANGSRPRMERTS
jgi:hypothetical protein